MIEAFEGQQNLASAKGWTCLGQKETCPKTGRPHYQFAVKTPQVRMSEVRKLFQGAHIEEARNKAALEQYVHKEDTRSGDLPKISNLYPTLDQTLNLFVQFVRDMPKRPNASLEHATIYIDGQRWLDLFDHWVEREAIPKLRLRVETLAVNPATRSAIKKYMNGIFERHVNEQNDKSESAVLVEDRQTDRHHVTFSQLRKNAEQDNESSTEEDSEVQTEECATDGDEHGEEFDDSPESDGESDCSSFYGD